MIGKYLQKLLINNKRVIVPDFGGFVVKRSAAGDVVSFNSFLKFNDGLLVDLIEKDLGVDADKAIKMMQDELVVLDSALEANGSCKLDDLGYLVKDKKGSVRFMVELPSTALSPQEVAEKQMEEEKKKPVSFEEELPVTKEADLLHDLLEEKEIKPVIDETPDESDYPEYFSPEEEKGMTLWHWVFAGIVLIFVVFWIIGGKGVFLDKQEQVVSQKADVVIEEVEVPIVEEAKYFLQPLETVELHGITVSADKDIAPLGEERYNIIVASFSVYDNAIVHTKLLNGKGFVSSVFDRYNGFYAVSIGSCPSVEKALEVCGENLKKTPEVWILVK